MSDTLAALSAAVIAAPADRTVRLVFADALDESGEPANVAAPSSFARRFELESMADDDPERAILAARCEELFAEHWIDWWRPVCTSDRAARSRMFPTRRLARPGASDSSVREARRPVRRTPERPTAPACTRLGLTNSNSRRSSSRGFRSCSTFTGSPPTTRSGTTPAGSPRPRSVGCGSRKTCPKRPRTSCAATTSATCRN